MQLTLKLGHFFFGYEKNNLGWLNNAYDIFSSIIEHTNQIVYLEDDDVAAVKDGNLTIHRVTRNDPNESTEREVMEVKMEIQEIMKGMRICEDHTLSG